MPAAPLSCRVQILIAVASVDFSPKGILNHVGTGNPRFSSTSLVHLANAESALGSKLLSLSHCWTLFD